MPFLTSSPSFPLELIEGEHFVLTDLYKSSSGISFKAVTAQEDQAEAATGALVRYVRVTQSQSPWPALRLENKERDRKRAWKTKVAGAGLEGFVDWMGILASEPDEEEEMSMLAVGFATWMHKWVADLKDESTPISNGKCLRRSSPDKEA